MKRSLLALSALAITVPASQAAGLMGTTTDNFLVSFDSATPGTFSAVALSGLGSDSLVGIDLRPANNTLYGLGQSGTLYTISTTGVVTSVATLSTALSGTRFGVDFNPVADRLRVTSNTGQNLRINVATGAVVEDGVLNGGTPSIVASAYTNSFVGTTSTQLFNLDNQTDSLYLQNPPNGGTQVLVGALGVSFDEDTQFEITPDGQAFAALGVGGSESILYSVNTTTGAATNIGAINVGSELNGLTSAPVPEPATMAVLGLGLAALKRRRKNG